MSAEPPNTRETAAAEHDPFAGAALARVVPTTEPQREVWLADHLSTTASLAFNESISLRFQGELELGALRGALHDLLDRHECLRATISANGEALCIAAEIDWELGVQSHANRSAAECDSLVAEAARRAVETPFDLEFGPLFRAELLRLGSHGDVLILCAHHIVCDGWSFGVVVRDLALLYRRRLGAAAEALAPPASFVEYALSQIAAARSAKSMAAESYWMWRFATAPAALDLPLDRPRSARRSFASRREDHVLDAELIGRARLAGGKCGASLFATLLSAFVTLLHRVCETEDIVVGVPAAGQSAEGQHELVGHCVSLLPVRIGIDHAMTWRGVVEATRTAMLDAYEHQELTLGTILRRLAVERDPSRLPLVSVMFNLDRALDANQPGFPGVDSVLVSNPRSFENFELFINAVPVGGKVKLECQYNSDLLDARTVRRWLGCFESILRSGCASLEARIAGIELVGGDERRALDEWNSTARQYSRWSTVHGWIEAQTARDPSRIALRFGEERLSYAELDSRANRIAHCLRSRGVRRSGLVGLHLERGPDMLAALLGILKTGAAYVPLDPSYPTERLEFMLEDAGMSAVVSHSALALSSAWPRETSILLDRDGAELARHSSDRLAEELIPAESESCAYVIYTSGSTGKPKGVRIPHRAVVNYLESVAKEPGIAASDRLVAVTTLSFDIAVTELLLPLCVGAEIVLASREQAGDGDALGRLLRETRASFMQATPSTWRLLIDAGWQGSPDFKVLCGGEALSTDLAQALLSRSGSVWNMYGPTETTVWSTCAQIASAGSPMSIGRPIGNTAVWILDPRGKLCPIGVPGEILIGGKGVALGYLNRPELTAERFVPDPFGAQADARLYRTGDKGRWRNDGSLEHLGRLDRQVKLRGFRIELGEIEFRLATHPELKQAVLLVREDRPGDAQLVAYLVSRSHSRPSEDSLRAHLRSTLPEYMVPQHFVNVPAIPLLPNGKLDLRALPARAAGAPKTQSRVAPRNESERLAADAMEAVLGIPSLSVDDNFFSLGGHSLTAAQLATRLSRSSSVRVPLRAIFDAPTIAQLGAWLERNHGSAEPPVGQIERQADQSRAPASLMQQRVWFLERFEPGRLTFNTPSAHRLKGPLDLAALERSFNEMIRRQAVLRTSLSDEGGVPVQLVQPELSITLTPIEDLSAIPAAEREAALMAALEARVGEAIDMRKAPLFKFGVYRLSSEEHVLFFMPHHVIWDGWSFDLFYAEMSALYAAFSAGREPDLEPLACSYGDFANWQQGWLELDDLQQQLTHWKAVLKDPPDPLDLPFDRPRPQRMSGNGSTLWLNCSVQQVESARRLGQRVDATLFMTLLAVYATMLFRTTGQTDLVIGTPVRGRHSAELEKLMGFFVNALPLRIRVQPQLPFLNLLCRVRDAVLEAFSAPDVPFERLVRELEIQRDESRSPLYQAFFSFQDARNREHHWGSLQQEQIYLFQPAAAEDLGLWFLEHTRGLSGGLTYNTDVCSLGTAESFCARFQWLLAAATAAPHEPIEQLSFLPSGEAESIRGWNRTQAHPPRAATTSGLLAEAASRMPERIALDCAGERLTYFELHARAHRLAHLLRSRGIARGSLVGLCLERTADMVVAQLAILMSGAAYVPLDPAHPADRLAFIAEDAGMSLLVTNSSLVQTLQWPKVKPLLLDQSGSALASMPDRTLDPDPQLDARSEDAAYVIYTSGSTGKPKGVAVHHAAVVNFLGSMMREPGLTSEDRMVAVSTLNFDIAVLELLLPLCVGARVILATRDESMDGRALRTLIASGDATMMQATPSTWRILFDAGWVGARPFKALVGGESLPADLARLLLERTSELWNMYGPTETTVWSTCWRVRQLDGGIAIGRPIANTQVHILDHRLQLCPIGVPGEIFIGGDGVALGYLNRPDLTAERFVPDPFRREAGARMYRTGDRGRWRQDGNLEHLGRLDSQLKVRGYRIEPGEIEAALMSRSNVSRAVVIAREDRKGDVRLVGYVVMQTGASFDGPALLAELKSSLPKYLVPQHLIALDALPLLPNGKLNRSLLPAPSVPDSATRGFVAPRTDLEISFASVWERVLGIEQVGITDSFFDLGGTSLTAIKLIFEMEAGGGTKIDLGQLFLHPTIAELVQTLGPDQEMKTSVVVPLQSDGDGIPIFCLVGVNLYRAFAKSLGKRQPVFGVYVSAEQALVAQSMKGKEVDVSIARLAEAYEQAIMRFRPRGPYRLAGLSFGGILAVELASRMRRRGEQVDLVMIFDTMLAEGIHRRWTKLLVLPFTAMLNGSAIREGRKLTTRFRDRLFKARPKPSLQQTPSQHERANAVRRAAFSQATKSWKADQLVTDYRVVLFCGMDRSSWGPHIEFDPDYGWSRYVEGPLSVEHVEGDHLTLIEPPNVDDLGHRAQRFL